jgi:glycosyltransferase involved in cell wall biosynthesis
MMAVKDVAPDIIHAQTPFTMGTVALATAKINKIPIVGAFHTLFPDTRAIKAYVPGLRANVLSRYAWSYARFFYNRCNRVIALTESIKVLLEKKRINNTVVVPNGIDFKAFNERATGKRIRRALQIGKNEKMILYLGRISKEKRLETLLHAAKYLDEDVKIVIGGTGPALQHYTNLAKRLGVSERVNLVGFVNESDIQEYYAACDTFCIPSTFEILCTTALEAFATGTPVVAADSMGFHDLIKNGENGEKFKPGDSRSCANKIKKVLNNISSYKEMRSTAAQYSNEVATDKLLSTYEDVLKNFTL